MPSSEGQRNSQYRLVRLTLGQHEPVSISAGEYAAIVRAKQGVVAALALEEKFNLLLENYAEYEGELLTMAVRDSLFLHYEWSSFQAEIHTANRRLVNLLTATKLYADHVNHELIQLYGRKAEIPGLYRSQLTTARSTSLPWRAMELLRNVVQHRAFPIHQLSLESSVDLDDPATRFVRHSVHPSFSVSELGKDPRLTADDRKTVSELAQLGETIQLTPMIRSYVAALAQLHNAVRNSMAADLETWDAAITGALERARRVIGDAFAIGAARIVESEDGEEEHDVVEVFDDLIKRRQFLSGRTTRVQHIANGYVSSRPKIGEA